MAKGSSKRSRYSREVEEISRMRNLSRILKAGDLENALLSNSAKDSETMSDNVLDSLLDNANTFEQGNERGLELIEKLTGKGGRVIKQKSIKMQRIGGKVKVKRSIHMSKKRPAKKASKRRK
jgi:hypothetical protein